ncbi:MAG: hypothetical protein HBSIN02_08760 [Bacteroidia bacterium]|nr:MAG: hypothetical protein HBSIN02_08760 [Bacteroidia bacterium]
MKYGATLSLIVAVGLALLSAPGCSKSSEPETETVTGDLFPLVAGHKFTFNGFIRHAVNDTNITATGAFYTGIMTVLPTAPPLPPNVPNITGTTFFISDSSFVNSSPATWVVSGFYVKRTSSTSGDIWFLTNAGRFYRQTGVARTDSLKWILLVRENAVVGESWVGFDSTYTSSTVGSARLKIDCVFDGLASISVNGQAYSAYKLTATRSVYVGGSSTPVSQGQTAAIWLVPDLGIVKFIFNSDGETPGFERNLLSKNF